MEWSDSAIPLHYVLCLLLYEIELFFLMFQSRSIDRKQPAQVKDANKYYFIEASIALFVSFLINVFVVAVFAHGLFEKRNTDVVRTQFVILFTG